MKAIIVYGNLEFTFRQQRPQKLACELSIHHPVVYINPDAKDREGSEEILHRPFPEDYPHLYLLSLPRHEVLNGNENLWSKPLCSTSSRLLFFSIANRLTSNNIRPVANIVMHPAFYFVPAMSQLLTVYDCMDLVQGFLNVHHDVAAGEMRLFRDASATVFTSKWLHDLYSEYTNRSLIVRNGFSMASSISSAGSKVGSELATAASKPISCILSIVYVGAIADWFDIRLFLRVYELCQCLPVEFICIGRDDIQLEQKLRKIGGYNSKITFTGELPHQVSMDIVKQCDVGIIPLNADLELIKATNPVKVYEYLALGLSVISNPIPEVEALTSSHIRLAEGEVQWIKAIEAMVTLKQTGSYPSKEQIVRDSLPLLSGCTWIERAQEYLELLDLHDSRYAGCPDVDAIIPSTGSHEILIKCLRSLCLYDFRQILVVLNGTPSDDIFSKIEDVQRGFPERRITVKRFKDSLGFTKAVNAGAAMSNAKHILIVNDDIIFSPWSLLPIFEIVSRNKTDDAIYNIATTNIDGDAYRPHNYYTPEGFYDESQRRYIDYSCFRISAQRLGMNCTLIAKKLFVELGGLPAVDGLGYGEDDRFFEAAQELGYKLFYLPGAYAHHVGSLTFNTRNIALKTRLVKLNATL